MVRPVESDVPAPQRGRASRVKRTDATPDKHAEHRVDDRGGQSGQQRDPQEKEKSADEHPLHAETVTLQGTQKEAGGEEGEDPEVPETPPSDHIDVTG